ncbi:hypothetical protein NEM56_26045, partial [Escherichia coli]|nr:hypothetical protein [Escherichia coli]
VDINGFNNGVTTVTLSVQDVSGSAIGTMTAPFSAAALSSWSTHDGGYKALYAADDSDSFYGGLGKNADAVRNNEALGLISALSSDFVTKWKQQGEMQSETGVETFTDSNATFFGVYGAGIEKGKAITITL